MNTKRSGLHGVLFLQHHMYTCIYACVCTHQYVCHVYVISLLLGHIISYISLCSTAQGCHGISPLVSVLELCAHILPLLHVRNPSETPGILRLVSSPNITGSHTLIPKDVYSFLPIKNGSKMSIACLWHQLVGGLKLSEKYYIVKWESSPSRGWEYLKPPPR